MHKRHSQPAEEKDRAHEDKLAELHDYLRYPYDSGRLMTLKSGISNTKAR